jgi:hypothetical protein
MKAASSVGCISAVLFGLLVACSGAAPDSTPSSSSKSSKTTGTDKNANDPTPPSSSTSTPPASTSDTPPAAGGTDAACAQKAAEACFTCCIDNHQKGEQVYDDALFGCLCAADKCATQCAQSACNQQNPAQPTQGDACDTCLAQYSKDDGSGACDKVADPACQADADCTAEGKCMDACPQQ